MKKHFLTISIPAYNDSRSLYKLVCEAQELCTRLKLDFTMLIINDGSKDDTLEVADKLAAQFNNIKVYNHAVNQGFGTTLREVFTMPESEWVLFLPGDNQFPVSNLEMLLPLREKFDFFIGYRKDRKDDARRKLYSIVYNKVVSVVSGIPVRDVNSIVFYRKQIVNNITLKSQSAFLHAEFFIKVARSGARIKEVEIVHQEREFGFGAGGNFKVIMATVRELFLFLTGSI